MSIKYEQYMKVPSESLNITPSTSAQEIDVTEYATANVLAIPIDTLTESIISGEVYEESTGDYAWRSTVNIPKGYHANQTIVKDFSDIFPKPESEGTSENLLIGRRLYNHAGKLIVGTMPKSTISTVLNKQGQICSIPLGYHDGTGTVTANIDSGSTTVSGEYTTNLSITLDSINKKVTAVVNDNINITPDVIEGYIKEGTEGNAKITGSKEIDLPVGTVNNPIATKGEVIDNTISVTPSVNVEEGYINSNTVSGTPVSISASELVSGTKIITPSKTEITEDVTNYKDVKVNAVPAGSIILPESQKYITQSTPTITKSGNTITANVSSFQKNIYPSVAIPGYIDSLDGFILNLTSTSKTFNINAQDKTVTENGTILPDSDYHYLSSVTVNVPYTIEVSTEAELTSLLVAANTGKVYKYTGPTSLYNYGDIYIYNSGIEHYHKES